LTICFIIFDFVTTHHHQPDLSTMASTTDNDDATTRALAEIADQEQDQQDQQDQEPEYPDLSLNDIIDGDNGRGIPSVKFVSEDVGMFVDGLFGPNKNATAGSGSSSSTTVSAELLIGAFSQLHAKYKSSEASLQGKRTCVFPTCQHTTMKTCRI
jgi:hypothetical protein